MNKCKGKKVLALLCAAGLVLGTNGNAFCSEAAKKPVSLSKTKATMKVGKSQTIQVKKAAKVKIKKKTFTSSDKSIATVSKTGKVSAIKAGTATIKAKVQYIKKPGKKVKTANLKCKITVTGQNANTNTNTTSNTNSNTNTNPTPNATGAGLYDLNGNLLKSWPELIAEDIIRVKDGVLTHFVGSPSLPSGYGIVIENGVTSIGEMSFYTTNNLHSIVIPEGVTTIEINAFAGCEHLEKVTLPKSLKSIGYKAFTNCYDLTDITLPDGLTSIGYEAFSSCNKIAKLIVPSSVTTVEDFAFSGLPLIIYDGDLDFTFWGEKQIQKSDGTLVSMKD